MEIFRRVLLALVFIGAINWGLIGLFQFDLFATFLGGQTAPLSRIVYTLVGISGLSMLWLIFAPIEKEDRDHAIRPGNINYSTEFGEETDFSNDEHKDK